MLFNINGKQSFTEYAFYNAFVYIFTFNSLFFFRFMLTNDTLRESARQLSFTVRVFGLTLEEQSNCDFENFRFNN